MSRLLLRCLQLAMMYRHIDNSWADRMRRSPAFCGAVAIDFEALCQIATMRVDATACESHRVAHEQSQHFGE